MSLDPPVIRAPLAADLTLQVYLLGAVDYDAMLAWQRRLVYTVAGDRTTGYLVLCEHAPLITIGRQGSRMHIRFDPEELHSRRWPVRWVNRGGGCLLHLPGQLAVYPILPLDRLGLNLSSYLDRLQTVVRDVLGDFSIHPAPRPDSPGLRVAGRLIADIGIAVRDWVAYYGGVLNIDADLEPFRRISCGGAGELPMTSLARERRGPLRPALVRERLVEHFAMRFGFERVSVFFGHPALNMRTPTDTVTAGR